MRRGMVRAGEVLFLLLATLGWADVQPEIAAPRPVDLHDSALIVYLGGRAGGERWQLVPATDSSGQLVLLRNGTEFSRVPVDKSEQMLKNNPDIFTARESAPELNFRPALARMEPDLGWVDFSLSLDNPQYALPEGVWLGYGGAMALGDRYLMEDRWNLRAAKRIEAAHVELGVALAEEYMNLPRAVRKLYGESQFSDWRFSVSLGLPLVRYTLRTETGALPQYFWLDTGIVDLYNAAVNGVDSSNKVVSQFENGMNGHASNVSHTLELRWWALRYRVLFDADVYVAPVHEFAFEGLPMGIGTWDVRVVTCNGRMAAGGAVEFGPYAIRSFHFATREQHLRWSPLRLAVDFADWSHFRMAGSTTFAFDGLWGQKEH